MIPNFLMCCAWIIGATLCWLWGERATAVAMMLLALRHVYLMELDNRRKGPSHD